jgi:hypothetical protein
MWKLYLGIIGVITGCVLSFPFLNRLKMIFFGLLIVGLPLVLGSVGFVVGMMLDARKVYWKGVLGILGLPAGAAVGYELARRMAAPSSFAGSDAIKGIVLGAPSGAILGCALGFVLGALFDKWSKSEKSTMDAGNPEVQAMPHHSFEVVDQATKAAVKRNSS